MTIASDSLVDKVKKLLALAGNNTNEKEAQAAAKKAAELINQYRLNAEQFAESAPTTKEAINVDEKYIYESARIIQWKVTLAKFLASYHGCAIYNDIARNPETGRKITRFRLAGTQTDMELARWFFVWIVGEIDRLSKHLAGSGHVWIQSFCTGFVNGVMIQLKGAKEEQENNATESQKAALVRLNHKEQESSEALDTLIPGLVTYKSRSYAKKNEIAYAMGTDRGKKLHLGKVMSEGEKPKMLK